MKLKSMRALDPKQPIFWMALLGIIVLANTFVLVRALDALSTYEARVTQTLNSISQIERMLSLLKDAETGQRGYLLTDDASYLTPYDRATTAIRDQIGRVETTSSDSPDQRARVAELERNMTLKLDELQRTIDLRQRGQRAASLDAVRSGYGQQLMDTIRTTATQIEAEEERVLERRREEARASRSQLGIVFGLTTGAALIFLVISGVVLTRSVREREQAAEQLRDQREWLDVTLSSIGDAVIATDTAGRVMFMNPVAEALTGWPLAEAEQRPTSDVFRIINEDTRATVESPIERVLRDGIVVGLANHTLLIRRNGDEIPIDDSGAPIRSRSSAVIGAVLVFRDITAQKRVEREQQLLVDSNIVLGSSLEYHETLDAVARLVVPRFADLCVVFAAEAGQIRRVLTVHVDPEHEQWLRELQEQPIDPQGPHPAARVIRGEPAEVNPDVSQQLLNTLAQDSSQISRMRALVPMSQIVVPLVTRQRTVGAVSFGRLDARPAYDQTELPLAQELARRTALALDNARLYGDARAAVQLRDAFLTTAAHELRTPLTSLLGQIQLLQRRSQRDETLSERGRRSLAVIWHQATRLNKMISTMLDVSRIENGLLQLSREPLDFGALTRQVVDELQPTLSQHRIECVTTAALVSGDALRLEQVIQNLVGNAIKYSPGGGVVHVEVTVDAQAVQLDVHDSGIGIPAEALPQLFQRFYRASNTVGHQIAGIGIGLYVVREIVQLHGGSIDVASAEGQGSTFTVRLPRLDTTDGAPASPAAPSRLQP